MKILTIKPGTKIRTKQGGRPWNKALLNKEGVVVGSSHYDSPRMITVRVLGDVFSLYSDEFELIKPLRLKKFSAWK